MLSLRTPENTTKAPPWYREMTQKTIGPSKLTMRPADLRAVLQLHVAQRLRRAVEARQVRQHHQRPVAADAALIARAVFFDDRGNSVPGGPLVGAVGREAPRRGIGCDSIPITVTGCPPEVRVQDDGRVGVGHAGPPLEHRVVLVGDRAHDRPDVERLLPVGVGGRREDVADGGELARRVACAGTSRTSRSRGSLVCRPAGPTAPPAPGRRARSAGTAGRTAAERFGAQYCAWPFGTHDAVVAAEAEVVLGRHPARVVQRVLAGQHHRAVRRHHQDALGVHEHRGLGVPVRLGADVDAGDDDVDLAAGLGELMIRRSARRDPVHVLGAAVHRDAWRRTTARTTRPAGRAPRPGRGRRSTRAHSGSATVPSALVGSPNSATRVMPSG